MQLKTTVTIDETRRNQKSNLRLTQCGLNEFSSGNMIKVCNSSVIRLLLNKNELEDLPEDFGLTGIKLQLLSLAYNQLTRLPITFGELHNLIRLNISYNDFSVEGFPRVICKLSNLRVLWANGIGINEIPEEIENMTGLRLLGLRNNSLATFPSSILKLPELKRLTLSRNSIQAIPSELEQAVKLIHLNLNFNQISVLPDIAWERLEVCVGVFLSCFKFNCFTFQYSFYQNNLNPDLTDDRTKGKGRDTISFHKIHKGLYKFQIS